ncbi:50S ribosomal protein L25, partial [candidate division WWE3 bacterium]|nr:50S ribosomal protein L25 [candidate division WWE3 bacterium]
MSEFTDLAVQSRSLFGDKVKQLRRSGFVPANIHGSGIESVAIQVETPNLIKLVSQVGESEIVTITIEGEKDTRPVLISEVQKDPVSYDVLHVDFRQVDLTKEVTVEAEIKLEGEPAILKTGKAILLELLDTLEVTALPNKLPSEIIV